MREIKAEDITQKVSDACVRVACDLGADVEDCIRDACDREKSDYGKYALCEVCENIKIARSEGVPLCQDTGIVLVFVKIGQDVHVVGGGLNDAINAGVRDGYERGYLRKSVVAEPVFERRNTGDNTPCVVYTDVVCGDTLEICIMPKGAGSENMTRLCMLKPAEGLAGVEDFVVSAVDAAGGNPCPPVFVGVGIGGTADRALVLSKRALLRKVGVRNKDGRYAKLEEDLMEKINKLGIGPQGFGGIVTALDVFVEFEATHIAMLPVAVTLNCHCARHTMVNF